MITFLMETLELAKFGHRTTCTIYFDTGDKTLCVTSWTETMMSKSFFKISFFKKVRSSQFC